MDALPLEYLSPDNLAAAILAVNLWVFALFSIDKAKARAGAWRVAESTLLLLALIGGTPGAYAGRRLFRHKTRKQPFCGKLHTIAGAQVLGLALLAGWEMAGRPPLPTLPI